MFKDKNPRGTWLINGFRRCAIGSFILIMSLFLLYGATLAIDFIANGTITSEEVMVEDEPVGEVDTVTSTQDVAVESNDQVDTQEVAQNEENDSVVSNTNNEKQNQNTEVNEQQDNELDTKIDSEQQDNELDTKIDSEQQEDDIEPGTEVIQPEVEVKEELDEAFQEEETQELVEIPVHGKYTLTISDSMLDELGDVVDEQGLDPMKILGEYIKELEIKERLQLINFALEKAQQIDVQEVWELVADGVDAQDIVELQGIIEEHFTTEEVDMLYEQYQQYAFAQQDIVEE